ncbi:family 16 glycosylhydrolase [Vibrio sp. HN007]|uniref:glycoside hydrolase family 16 protein n=1 Tax=Vibrio iocasae TaxID=3098914 RepID=UPI0035D4C96E
MATALIGLSGVCLPITAYAQNDSPETDDWELVWSDEFTGGGINQSKWNFDQNCWGGGNDEAQCYTNRAENAFIEEGVLVIKAQKETYTGSALPEDHPNYDVSNTQSKPYTSARLQTKNKGDWKYARVDVRAKLPAGQGTWPAIWMLPTDNVYGTWAASGEIDIVESVNLKVKGESKVHGTLHYGRKWPDNVYSGTSYELPDSVNPADDFHVYSVEWSEGKIRWLIDGIHFATQTSDGWYTQYQDSNGEMVTGISDAPFNERFHLILNLAVGGSWAASQNDKGIDESAFPARFEVDYVRVYQCPESVSASGECSARDDSGKVVKGKKAPDLSSNQTAVINAEKVTIFDKQMADGIEPGTYKHSGNSTYAIYPLGDESYIEVVRTGPDGNFYLTLPKSTDLSSFMDSGRVLFDLKVISAASNAQLLVKIDSGWPATSDYKLSLPESGVWKEISLPVKEIMAGGNSLAPGNFANIQSVSNILVLEPTNEMTYQIKNIRWER